MSDCIGILNSGLSSIKFSIFLVAGEELRSSIRGQIEGLFTSPHFVAKDDSGSIVKEKFWSAGVTLDHHQATEFLLEFLRDRLEGMRLIGVGQRVVHGGLKYTGPVLLDHEVLDDLEKLMPLAPLHQPYNLEPIRMGLERRPDLPHLGGTQAPTSCGSATTISRMRSCIARCSAVMPKCSDSRFAFFVTASINRRKRSRSPGTDKR